MSFRGAGAAQILAVAAVLVSVGCSGDGALVGGRCASGYHPCGHACVDLMTDESNCGACGAVCAMGSACRSGACVGADGGPADAWPPDAGPPEEAGDGAPEGACDAADAEHSEAAADGADAEFDGQDATPDGVDGGPDADAGTGIDVVDSGAETNAPEAGSDGAEPWDADASEGSDVSTQDSGEQACKPPYDDPQHCGTCETVCPSDQPVCMPLADGGFGCSPLCEPPMLWCGGVCTDVMSNEEHCGSCGHACVTGLCMGGACEGAAAGHIVLIGMDYQVWQSGSPPARVFGNAVFLPIHTPLRVMLWSRFASCNAFGCATKVRALIDDTSMALGRPYELTDVSSEAEVSAALGQTPPDIFLVPNQPDAPPGMLGTIADGWKAPLQQYVKSGGVVVTLMSSSGVGEMPDFVTRAGLGEIAALQDVTMPAHVLKNNAAYDVVGSNVLSPFLARPRSAALVGTMAPGADTVFVVLDANPPDAGAQRPVVIHKVVLP